MNNTQNTKAKNKKALKLVKRPSAFWYGLERTLEVFLLPHVQIKRINCDGLKPPYIVIASYDVLGETFRQEKIACFLAV